MILHALTRYYQRISQERADEVAPEGFERKEIPFVIVLDHSGNFVGLEDTREGTGKKKQARVFIVPKGAKKTSGIVANLFWDTPAYAVGRPKPDPKKDPVELAERAEKQFFCFQQTIRDACCTGESQDEAVLALLRFLEKQDFEQLFLHPGWEEVEEKGMNVSFRLNTDHSLICQRPDVVSQLASSLSVLGEDDTRQVCLVSGKSEAPARLHTAIKGVWGAQTSGANIVSFNLGAFCSYGKKQGLNAPVGRNAETAYTTALNTLLVKGSKQRMQVGDASTVFWAEEKNDLEDVFADIFGDSAKENPEQANKAVRILYESPKAGTPSITEDYTPFFVLGLSPNASRIAVRFWHAGTVGETALHIRQHFEDCQIVRRPKDPEHLSLFRLLVSTALQGKSENIAPNLGGECMKAILTGTPYPQTLLAAVVRRCRAEREVTYPRAALLKAVLVRAARYYRQSEQEVGMALDINNTNIGYRLGRLFATLEKIQEEASPGINATIRDRFYGGASGSPVTAFPHLMKLKNHHLAKIENRGRVVNLEKIIGEIMSGIVDFPTHLSLQDQGRFAVGYYHQRRALFTKHETNE
ncbi:type I-C CRISPR-associated protein Cas8c/Csd1 [Desulfobulbus oligotrophicus]|jgi:CRISPR-associated protein Csd1|uniref:Type I-C CRISPR-associated protein Cas8c/Csd1 n=1 Tax=Desulfobulbus oligotrophicus TaxID=1909699 RepID=A0A7T5VDY9_9BACT|nr:type I-C CRISPR-associated protein Cas8c/Csd1 [Desulfobulbus oligotrophicus]MDY0391495.1 type I-C CRISPR-associated protein Cas8c/Csd1 [Desulfobulbus oligotrophicus]QQG66165.1 type I-C CRISPR-associated protein Cas8c/Csd1 [Desulfobulbus oligotrophicus]